jgi:AraC family transcriptional regulator
MSSSASAGTSVDRVSGEPTDPFDEEMLSKLIAAACASLDSDHATAKEYIERAAELLQVSREERGAPPSAFSYVRGGLACWQQKRVVAYVEANIGSKIRAVDLAGVVRLSTTYFFRAFRASFREPPMAYVVKRRVLLGQELMRNSRASLSQIALACGMCDQAHFTRAFHRIVGMSPGLWRRQFAGGHGSSERPVPRADAALRAGSA